MNRLSILVVDDEMGMRMAVARALDGFIISMPDIEGVVDLSIIQAASGEEALEILDKEPVDIMLLDHKMTGISGLDVLEKVNEKKWDCLTIMITAYASLDTAITATKRGAFDFLAKPFTPEELKAAVRKAAKHLILQRQARKLAEEKRQIRFQLISVMAHELKAPLGAIEGYLYLLRDRPMGDDWEAYSKPIARTLERLKGMRKLITDTLDMTRIESGQKKREIVPICLADLAQAAIESVTPDAEERRIAINFKADPSLAMLGDAGEIEIVFNNLLTNAVKYNRDDGSVDVSITAKNGMFKIQVADTGIGMTEEDCAKLFNEFVRIKTKETKNIPGTGLGLSILKKIAQLYQGDATVKSKPGVGTTFTVTLKSAEPPAEEEKQEQAAN